MEPVLTAPDSSHTGFRISLRLSDGVVAGVAGDLDMHTGPDLAAVLGALVGRGHQTITVECDELAFIDAAGLRALVAMRGPRLVVQLLCGLGLVGLGPG